MLNPTATLYTTMYFDGETDRFGFSSEVEVSITYKMDGGEPDIEKVEANNCPDELWDALYDAACDYVADVCDEAYSEWLAEYGEYLADMRADQAA